MLLDYTSITLIYNLVEYFRKNQIICKNLTLSYFAGGKTQWFNLTYDEFVTLLKTQYSEIDYCSLGNIWTLEQYEGTSTLYKEHTTIKLLNPVKNLSLVMKSDYNIERLPLTNRNIITQRNVIENAVAQFKITYDHLKLIRNTGIYSPCYAIPGWSEGTLMLFNTYNQIKK